MASRRSLRKAILKSPSGWRSAGAAGAIPHGDSGAGAARPQHPLPKTPSLGSPTGHRELNSPGAARSPPRHRAGHKVGVDVGRGGCAAIVVVFGRAITAPAALE